jgi:purine-cytosine permease-like protein
MISLLITMWILIWLAVYFFMKKRIYKVYQFRIRVIDICCDYNKSTGYTDNSLQWLYSDGPSFKDMVFSFKKLTLDNWYEEEKLKRIFE